MTERTMVWAVVNIFVALAAAIGFAVHRDVAHPLYVILLFAICSVSLLPARRVNGPYTFLVLWSAYYFGMYGALDLRNLVLGSDRLFQAQDGMLDEAETVILVGALLFSAAYLWACRERPRRPEQTAPKNWSESMVMLFGLSLWVICTKLCWDYRVNLVTQIDTHAAVAAMNAIGGIKLMIFMLARMAQPLSILMIAYAQSRYGRPWMTPVVLAVVMFQLLYGFIIDTKADALIGCILVMLTYLLVRGKIPKFWATLMLLMMVLAFPILQANRVVRDEHGVDATKASQNVLGGLRDAIEASTRVNTGSSRAQTLLERITTKGSVEMIVIGMNGSHPYQHGATLVPILTAFIPRLLWPDKPGIATGQVLNREFHVSESEDTYISPSHLGELYWNFGWSGVIGGMTLLGLLFGHLGRRFDLKEAATVTRVLVVVVTVRQIILASEGELAVQYVVWLRSLAAIGILHWLFARTPWTSAAAAPAAALGEDPRPAGRPSQAPPIAFPNLLR